MKTKKLKTVDNTTDFYSTFHPQREFKVLKTIFKKTLKKKNSMTSVSKCEF